MLSIPYPLPACATEPPRPRARDPRPARDPRRNTHTSKTDDLSRENEALREQIATLTTAILRVLSLSAGRVVTYDALLRQVWKGGEADNVDMVRNFVKKLRAKLGEDARNPAWIFNLCGVGYRMARPDGG